jgi:hypothetical protein
MNLEILAAFIAGFLLAMLLVCVVALVVDGA